MISVVVNVVEIGSKVESYFLDSVPHNWHTMGEFEQRDYLQSFGEFVESKEVFNHMDHVESVRLVRLGSLQHA